MSAVLEIQRNIPTLNLSVTRIHYARPTMPPRREWIGKLEIHQQLMHKHGNLFAISECFRMAFKEGRTIRQSSVPREDFHTAARRDLCKGGTSIHQSALIDARRVLLRGCVHVSEKYTHRHFILSVCLCASVDEREMYTCTHTHLSCLMPRPNTRRGNWCPPLPREITFHSATADG